MGAVLPCRPLRKRATLETWARAVRALLIAWALVLAPTNAAADVSLALAPDGYVGAWLVAGPIPAGAPPVDPSAVHPALRERLAAPLSWLAWSLVDGGAGPLDVARALGAVKGSRALIGGMLELAAPLDGWLLVSADGSIEVAIDGKPAFRRASPHPRGPAWDLVPLELGEGSHTVVLDLERHGGAWLVEARILAKSNLEPPQGALFRLPGGGSPEAARLEDDLARVDASSGLAADGFHPYVRVEFPRGAPADSVLRVTGTLLRRGKPVGGPLDSGPLTPGPALEVALPGFPTSEVAGIAPSVPDELRVRVAARPRAFRLDLSPGLPAVVKRALAARTPLSSAAPSTLRDRDVILATLDADIDDLRSSSDTADPATSGAAARLRDLLDRIEAGNDPLDQPGVVRLARRSRIDGAPEPLSLHVPASYRAGTNRRFPLVVVLHGLHGNPERAMASFLGTDSSKPHPRVDGFVVAPHAHGDAFYRGPGESEVMDTIDWVLSTYPIDRARVSITGISMGGTGAAHLGLRYPDRFSAIGALAGYHSYFVRRDVRGHPIRAWERTELSRWSPASWAENGHDELLYVAQGTRDLPLEHSLSLADRYRDLGYPLVDAWPDIGHDVWRIAWGDAALWPLLSSRHTPAEPSRVVLKTDSLRYGRSHWASITGLLGSSGAALLDARIAPPNRIVVRTTDVAALALQRPVSMITPGPPLTVEVDGVHLDFGTGESFSAHRDGSGWKVGVPPASPMGKHAGLEGPIRDAFAGPLAFVYGTLDPRQTRAAREVAEHFKARWSGNARFPVLRDTEVDDDLVRTHSLFLVGGSSSNRIVRDLDALLPFGIDGSSVRAGQGRITGDAELGFACIYPNPKNPARYVVLLEGVDARGLFRSMSLPMQLPDFIVFDSGLAPAAAQQILGEAHVLGAGYFDRSWALPTRFADEPAAPERGAGSAGANGRGGALRTPASAVRAPPP